MVDTALPRPDKARTPPEDDMLDLTRVLDHARIPELPNPYFGKVRDCYDLPATSSKPARRILISSDRISAFDRILAAIPFKGQVLTQTARFWFDLTADICPNHVLSYPDPNVVIGRHLTILPVEIVVRGFLAGTTGTSILTLYRQGPRSMYGHTLPDGLRNNQVLPTPLLTPTSKAFDGGHDAPLTPAQIVGAGLLTAAQWDEISGIALALFARGQKMAADRGLILVDTKYEFGTDDTGRTFNMMEDGSETLSREEVAQLAARQEKFIQSLNAALVRIENKTYGVCRVSGQLIPKERLRFVPHATMSIDAKNAQK
jgi:phosphoribosylaminoimidazole-succinocarboxamide synthase